MVLEEKIFSLRLKNTKVCYAFLTLLNPLNIPPAIITVLHLLGVKTTCKKCFKFTTLDYLALKISNVPMQIRFIKNTNWDLLIVLDSCRYDYFIYCYKRYLKPWLKHSITKVLPAISPASYTAEWLTIIFNIFNKFLTFHKGINPQLIIITANPFYSQISLKSPYLYIEHVWRYGFNPFLKTIHPHEVVKAFIRLITRYPNRIFLIHFMQPHFPSLDGQVPVAENKLIAKLVGKGIISASEIRQSYLYNLKVVLKYVLACLVIAKIAGLRKAIITSDHGDLLEYGGHPCDIYSLAQTLVPWCEIDLQKIPHEEILQDPTLRFYLKLYKLYNKIHTLRHYISKKIS